MKLLSSALIVTALTVGGCSGQHNTQLDRQAIQELIKTTEAMNNDGNVDGWLELFEEGAVYMPPGHPAIATREGLHEVAVAGFVRWKADITITPDEIVFMGEWAFARSTVTGTVVSRESGASYPVDVKQLVLYHRQTDGGWKIARLINNNNNE